MNNALAPRSTAKDFDLSEVSCRHCERIAGALLFALPMLMTMECRSLGSTWTEQGY